MKVGNESSLIVAEDSGNANPDSNFRYAGGFYIFNLSLKNGLDTGMYLMLFKVNGVADPAYTVEFNVK